MADRTVYGLDFSENGWRMVDQGSCVWVQVPGTNVTLQIREGQPAAILGAFVADWNSYIEPVRDADSACWTPTNSVASSNHLSGTACDVNWDSHPFRVADAGFNPAQLATMDEMLDYYQDLVFWGNRWTSPKDAMHIQMNGDTYGAQNVARVQDFISRKIRSDGFSTFRRSTVPPLSRSDRYALAIISEGQKHGVTPRGCKIALSVALVETNLTMYANSNVPASMDLPHDAVGSDHDSTGLFQQRQAWGPLSCTMDPACSAGLFYNGGKAGQRGLTDFDYNDTSVSPGTWAQRVQVSAFPDRYDQRFGEAEQLYNRLLMLPPPPPGDDMALVPQDQWDRLYTAVMAQRRSRSPLRELDEGDVGDAPDQIWDVDSSVHILVVFLMATLGEPGQLALLNRVANADPARYPDRQADRDLAQAILAEVADNDALKAGILAALGRVTVNLPPVVTGEVLPAVVQPRTNTPQDLLDTLDKLKTFDDGYRQRFDALTEKEITP